MGWWRLPFSEQLDGLTCPLYLLHAHIGYMIFANFANETNKWLVYVVAFLAVILCSYLLGELVEVRAKTFWYRAFTWAVGRPITAMSARISALRLRLLGHRSRKPRARGGDPDLAHSTVS
ncbi:hypothetical protein [Yonghaparkia sp. Root332]|uniref:hypothetical protein n=1 Tax=Yonghaparkia sp. Root332 TaxID=1736516 RepID=UPI0006F651D5|nr:hypothetical protein [Yonghaparkia sp. Root332]KQV25451.1 hypothetical protein ASC54_00095 [Yonghaparkia sp. Root332]